MQAAGKGLDSRYLGALLAPVLPSDAKPRCWQATQQFSAWCWYPTARGPVGLHLLCLRFLCAFYIFYHLPESWLTATLVGAWLSHDQEQIPSLVLSSLG